MEAPNYTMIDNQFLACMHKYTGSVIKTYLAMAYETVEWHNELDIINLERLKTITGLTEKTLKKCFKKLKSDGWLSCYEDFWPIIKLSDGRVIKHHKELAGK